MTLREWQRDIWLIARRGAVKSTAISTTTMAIAAIAPPAPTAAAEEEEASTANDSR